VTTYIVPLSVGVADRALGGGRGASTPRCGGGGGGSSSYLSSCCSIRWCLGLGTGCLRTTDEGWLNHAVTVAPWDRGGGRGRVADCGGAALINESAKRKEQLQVFMDDGRVEEEASPGHPMHRTHNPIRTFPSSELKHTRLSPAQGRARTSSRKTSQRRRRGRPKPQTESLGQRRYAHSAPPPPPPPTTTPTPHVSATSGNHAATTAMERGAPRYPLPAALPRAPVHPHLAVGCFAALATTSAAVASSGRLVDGTSGSPQPASNGEVAAAAAAAAPAAATGVPPRGNRGWRQG